MADDFIFDINAYVQGNNGNILPITIRNKGAVVDITGATVRVAIKQGAYLFTKQAVITDAANGKCEVTLTREDLTTAGLYFYQPTITYADDREFSGDVEKFRVSGKLTGAPPVITPGMIELSRLGINASGKLTIDGVEQIGGTLPANAILFEDWVGGETVTIDTGTTPPPPDTTAPVLTITPSGGTFATTQGVTMATNETATIYYTFDGLAPTTASAVYSTALSLNATTTLKAFAKDTAGNSSAVQTVTFTKDVSAPADTTAPIVTATPSAGTYTSAQSVTLSANETATIYYTTNGTTPTTASTVYSAPIQVSATTTLQYMGVDTAGNASVPVASTYTVNLADTTAPVLTMTPAGTFTDTQTVTMSANETATIYYTLDDTDPKVSGTKLTYTAPLTLTATDTVKAYAVDTAGNESAVQTVTYTKSEPTSITAITDTFPVDKADLTSTETGEVWTKASSSTIYGVIGGQFYIASGANASSYKNPVYVSVNSASFAVEVDYAVLQNGTNLFSMIPLRYVSGSDFVAVYMSGSNKYRVIKWVAGAFTEISPGLATVQAGDRVRIEHYSNGDIKVLVNGILDTTSNDTFLLGTSHKVGLGTSNTVTRFDNFKVLPL